jgi:stage III sporulation protein AE
MKRFLIVFFILLLIPSTAYAASSPPDASSAAPAASATPPAASDDVDKFLKQDFKKGIDESLDSLDLKGMASYFEAQKASLAPLTRGKDLKEFIRDLATGRMFADYGSIFQYILSLLFEGVKKSVPAMVQIIVIALLFSLLSGFMPAFGQNGVTKTAFYAQFLLIGGISIAIFTQVFSEGVALVNSISGFSTDFFPVLFFLLTALGGITSVNLLKPAAAALTGVVSMYIQGFIMPLLILLCVFVVLNHISANVKFNGFVSLIKSVIKWALGISFIVFLGIVALQGLLGGTFDGISIKAAKFTIDKVVPIIGGLFAETVDMLVACSLLIKNAVGIAGILILLSMILVPVLNLLAQYFLFKFAGAVIEPIGDGNIASFLKGVSDVVMHLIVVILTTGAMFVISTALIAGAGNMNVMLR